MEPTDDRLAVLERKLRRAQRLAIAALALAALALVAAAVSRLRPSSTVRAERWELVDDEGRVRAALGGSAFGHGLLLHDREGNPRGVFGVDKDGSPRLRFATAEGLSLVDLTVYASSAPKLALSNMAGHEFFAVSLNVDGSSRLELADQDGRPRALLHAATDGAPTFSLLDRRGTPRAELSVGSDDVPLLLLEGRDGNVFRAPAGEGKPPPSSLEH